MVLRIPTSRARFSLRAKFKVSFQYWDGLSTQKVRVYSVILGDSQESEFDKFENKEFPGRDGELAYLYDLIELITERGCRRHYFRFEQNANAVAVLYDDIDDIREQDGNSADQGIRLYCYIREDDLLVLFNGDVKTVQNPRDCPNVGNHFKRPLKIASKIDQGIADGEINLDDPFPFTDIELEI
ncbi:MAG: hypothetical protein GXC78_12770 [Chitinophagaceae bacterium]|nr:hypothetical protein [Chitinophagaceae bacterium]